METPSGDTHAGAGLRAAASRFLGRSSEIQELFNQDDNFREMCDDLAVAEQALAASDQLPAPTDEERRAEYQALIDDLVREIGRALSQARIVPISRPPKR
jgi:hypothetical protein